jgi:hypothetical protein
MGEIGGSLAHTYRTRETLNADSERSPQNEHQGGENPEAVRKAIAERIPEKHRSNAVLCVEYLITASPEHFEKGQDGSAYFAAAVEWLKERHGAENVVATAIHRDETSPHLVAYVVPLDAQGKLNARSFLGGKAALSAMQTDFAEKVGRAHGLERGLEGSKATHTTINEYYGRVSKGTSKTPSVSVPEPSVGERFNVKAYGDRVAESVIQQLGPELKQLRAKEVEAQAKAREQASTIRGRDAQLKLAHADLLEARSRLDKFSALTELQKISPAAHQQLLQVAAATLVKAQNLVLERDAREKQAAMQPPQPAKAQERPQPEPEWTNDYDDGPSF